MAKRVWTINLEDGTHTIELEHGYFSGKRKVRVNGWPLELGPGESRSIFDFGSEHAFQMGRHMLAIHIRTNGLTYYYDLSIDGRSVKTGAQVPATGAVPKWAWVFVAACALIPVISIGGAIPAAIGFGGGGGCYTIAKDDSKDTGLRILMCVGVTALCWALFIGMIMLFRRAT